MTMNPEQTHMSEEDQFAAANAEFGQPEQGEQQAAPAPAAPAQEPFEGFSALPEAVRARFTESTDRMTRLEQDLTAARRQYGALQGRVPALQRELAELQKRTAAAPSSAQAKPMSAEAWEKFKANFPEDAKAFEEALARQAGEMTGKLSPIESELKELREWREQVQQQMTEAENLEIQETLDEAVPDWRVIAGWETADGKPGDQNWHPEFQAWLDSQHDKVRAQYDELLSSRDGADIVYVINLFKRDYIDLLNEEGASAPAPVSRRQQALRDVMPTGGANGVGERPRINGHMSEEDQFAATVAQYQDRWAAHG